MSIPLSVLLVSPEVAPLSKTGGLADMTASLGRALTNQGHQVTFVTPRYRGVDTEGNRRGRVGAVLGGTAVGADLIERELADRSRVVLVDYPPYYDRDGIYGTGGVDYADNAFRYALLARAAAEVARSLGARPIVHAHDWQTGLTPLFMSQASAAGQLDRLPCVFTIHNLAYQGLFPASVVPALGLARGVFGGPGLEFWGKASFLKAGINYSDVITTVSPHYAQEILTEEYGFGFEGIVAARADRLVGILNGIDEQVWNPETDPLLPARYGLDDLSGKTRCKAELLRTFGFDEDEHTLARPLIGMVSRMVDQKGLDLLSEASEELPGLGVTFAVLGAGEARYEAMWRRLAGRFPERIGVRVGFDEGLAHLIEAGADMFLMPSRFEPCGLNQMYSMRYGTVPIVRATGGLHDSVEDFDDQTGRGSGFRFVSYTPEAMFEAIERALAAFEQPAVWRQLMLNGMRQDFSWDQSAREYVRVYERAVQASRGMAAEPPR